MTKPITIPFNKPHYAGKELSYIRQAIKFGKISGDGLFTKKCYQFFQERYGFNKILLTTSCTDALEMSAILAGISPGDEVIMPSFTFPSTANAFVLRGAKIVFADSRRDHPNIDASKIASLITKKTKAIVPVHYAGVACEMDEIMQLAAEHKLYVIEDAAQAMDSYYKSTPLGQIGHFGTFSFHETKNISSGEGGLLSVNKDKYFLRAEIIREKGTNRSAFFRGEVAKYNWVDIGSSFLPSDIIAAVLYAQLEKLETIQRKRLRIWEKYYKGLKPLANAGHFLLPTLPSYATNNAHLFYIVCRSYKERQSLIDFLKQNGISAIFHYLPLHRSDFYRKKHEGPSLPYCDYYSRCLLRLPLFCDLALTSVDYIINKIVQFFDR
ncbi:MAG TPA: dTDP-4-amino-4,6-dideoxygalactose transaminase [Rhabdochlamydiaceae bacterium]